MLQRGFASTGVVSGTEFQRAQSRAIAAASKPSAVSIEHGPARTAREVTIDRSVEIQSPNRRWCRVPGELYPAPYLHLSTRMIPGRSRAVPFVATVDLSYDAVEDGKCVRFLWELAAKQIVQTLCFVASVPQARNRLPRRLARR